MKPTYTLFSISFVFIILLSTSCKKDSLIAGPPLCDTCKIITVPSIVTWDSLFINDSSWVRQEEGMYKSDISTILNQFGTSPSKVYSIYLVIGESLIKIFPDSQASFMDGTIYGTVYMQDKNEACAITFVYLDKDKHYGETPHGGSLPFSSIEIEILLNK
jgi:hypothetical protein